MKNKICDDCYEIYEDLNADNYREYNECDEDCDFSRIAKNVRELINEMDGILMSKYDLENPDEEVIEDGNIYYGK